MFYILLLVGFTSVFSSVGGEAGAEVTVLWFPFLCCIVLGFFTLRQASTAAPRRWLTRLGGLVPVPIRGGSHAKNFWLALAVSVEQETSVQLAESALVGRALALCNFRDLIDDVPNITKFVFGENPTLQPHVMARLGVDKGAKIPTNKSEQPAAWRAIAGNRRRAVRRLAILMGGTMLATLFFTLVNRLA